MDFGRFLMGFWMIFQWFLIEFWLIFDLSTAAPTARHSARGFTKRLNDLLFLLILEGLGLPKLINKSVPCKCPSAVAGCWRSLRYTKNQSKIYQKSLKNHSKIFQKSTKIHRKSIKNLLKSALGASWGSRGSKTPPRPLQPRKQGGISPPPRAPFWKDFGAMLAPRAT